MIVLILLWLAIGIGYSIWHWTKEFDLDAGDLVMCAIMGIFWGPVVIIILFLCDCL
jgi:hypothetical protein